MGGVKLTPESSYYISRYFDHFAEQRFVFISTSQFVLIIVMLIVVIVDCMAIR